MACSPRLERKREGSEKKNHGRRDSQTFKKSWKGGKGKLKRGEKMKRKGSEDEKSLEGLF